VTVLIVAVPGEQVAPRASRPPRAVLIGAGNGWPRKARRVPGTAAVRFAPVWSLRPIILVDYRQPRALARGPAPLEDAARGEVLGRSRDLQVGQEHRRPRARPRSSQLPRRVIVSGAC
jgi:hypothetical protein